MYDDELHGKASAYANNRKDAYLEKMRKKEVEQQTNTQLNWIWVAHYEGYKEGYWTATGDDRFTTDPDKLKEKKHMTKQEPVGYVSEGEPDRLIAQKQTKTPLRNYRLFTHDVPLYTTPQLTQVKLTDEEMKKIWYAMQNIMGWYSFEEVARAIEAAHGIKE